MPAQFCENFKGYLVGYNDTEALLIRARCKQWSCEYCCNVLRKQWRAVIIDNCNKIGGDWYFMTLTAHENARTRALSLINLQNGWKKLIERIRRHHNGILHYVRVYECHKNGRVHIHAITNFRPDDYKTPKSKRDPGSRWLKDNARQCGMGYQVKIVLIEGHAGNVAGYVTKYITKDMARLPMGTRRIQTTQRFKMAKIKNKSLYTWHVQEDFTTKDLRMFNRMNMSVIDVALEREVTFDDFEEIDYNPVIDES